MSGDNDYATIAAELLAKRKPEARARGVDRLHGISVVTKAMAAREQRHARRRALQLFAGLSAAASIALVGGWLGARAPTDSVAAVCSGPSCAGAHASSVFGTIAGRPFEPGQSIAAGRGQHATVVEFGRVTRIALDQSSELEYRHGDRTQRFGLLSGAVHLKVEKLAPGQRFVVETIDAQVEVRGTVFDVALAAPDDGCASPRTRVSVEEGVVEVRSHGNTWRVQAGESWPVSCDQPAPVAAPEVGSATASRGRAPRTAHGSKHELLSSGISALSEQNNLYAEAAALHRAGRLSGAISAYEHLLARYPHGPLAESASVGRLRILAKSERTRARDEARRYLARYPQGIASAEAQALLLEP